MYRDTLSLNKPYYKLFVPIGTSGSPIDEAAYTLSAGGRSCGTLI